MSQVYEASRYQPPSALDGVQTKALIVGVVAAAISIAGFFLDRTQFFQSYLVGWIFWFVIALGCLGWTMIQHLTGGLWALVLRRVLEAAARTLPFFGLLFLPFVFGMEEVWSWTRPEAANDPLIQEKVGYLNQPFFWGRFAFYFVFWTVLAFLLSRNSAKQDEGDEKVTVRMRMISGPGIVLFVLIGSFASFDWLMSLEPHWFSSLFGFYFISSTALAAMLFMIVCAWWLHRQQPLDDVLTKRHFHDYGKFTLALVMFWAYMTLSQFLITWSGHIPEFTQWYDARNTGGWKSYTVPLIVLHFFVPFLILLSASLKKQPSKLVLVALYMLVMRFFDLYWQAAPNWHETLTFHWLDVTTLVAVGGLWLFVFVRELKRRALLPVGDPYLKEVLGHV
ncbi:MAG: hypothetical protein DWQ36_17215 [Acidobacteria bacterium]|nr:MAG: hypothetical protein DWQ30_05310 [Acidobacteriota bacterium]REK04588.1 MAG: hypothetical protein DWQ36_17215 [Acidobacteriota bacterium]